MSDIQVISAGAGSGKTYTLTGKLRDLLASGTIRPEGVVATTFTRLAAGELKERVRGSLIKGGHHTVATEVEQALIGTVNSVCGVLLKRFAFEAGLPPEQRTLEETQAALLFNRAMEHALATRASLVDRMNALARRVGAIDIRTKALLWRTHVKNIADAARANNMSAAFLRQEDASDIASLLAYFPKPASLDLDAALLAALHQAIAQIAAGNDKTGTTQKYVAKLEQCRAALINDQLTWPDWVSLAKAKPAKASLDAAQPVADIAARFGEHPDLCAELEEFSRELFLIAADTLEHYQNIKQSKGLVDFIDQEQQLYALLAVPAVAGVLREELELLLVDEFQDTSPIQLALFTRLSELADNVIWVGDLKQSVYGFRGADPALMQAVIDGVTTGGNEPTVLDKSYRSQPALVNYTNALFVPAFAHKLPAHQVELAPALSQLSTAPAVESWQLAKGKKVDHYAAVAEGISQLLSEGREVVDKETKQLRSLLPADVAVLCKTNADLADMAMALSQRGIPAAYKRAGLLATPEAVLTLACLRRLVSQEDSLATAEIISLSGSLSPDAWLAERIDYLAENKTPNDWGYGYKNSPLVGLDRVKSRLIYLTPVEALDLAIHAGNVLETIETWGPNPAARQQRYDNVDALMKHAHDYIEQCSASHEPATTPGLILWLQTLAGDERDTQAVGGNAAVRVMTHHGAKGLEWPVVIAMNLNAKLKPRLFGLTVQSSNKAVRLDDPLAGRTLRYWPRFNGSNEAGVRVLEEIVRGTEGTKALIKEEDEGLRLLYVSLTRARDTLILALPENVETGPWMGLLNAHWFVPTSGQLQLPNGISIPTRVRNLAPGDAPPPAPGYYALAIKKPQKLDLLPLGKTPSSMMPIVTARAGRVLEIGASLGVKGNVDALTLGSAVHAAIAARLFGQDSKSRILDEFDIAKNIDVKSLDDYLDGFFDCVNKAFSPTAAGGEVPIVYRNAEGQQIRGFIDMLLESGSQRILIDHKTGVWGVPEEAALRYSGQLEAYAEGIKRTTGCDRVCCWIHFVSLGKLLEVVLD
ncbi:ATP-dependent exoDNAse (exonuclease V) beta subunit [gamma proteobacterium NOR5-3]|nr:ATP-dependent exoDNAse (exonuclease V) beta subunit [gamma proteobacterium NOR5-3]